MYRDLDDAAPRFLSQASEGMITMLSIQRRGNDDSDLRLVDPLGIMESMLAPWDDFNYQLSRTDVMRCDVKENDDSYEVKADIPGADKNDIDVHYTDGKLSIEYKHDSSNDTKDDNGYLRRERHSEQAYRCFALPNGTSDGIKANYIDGVLTVSVPKQAESKSEPISIE